MGRACLRDHRHPRSAGGAGSAPAGGGQQDEHRRQPDAAGSVGDPEWDLRACHHGNAVGLGYRRDKRHSHANPDPKAVAHYIGEPGGDRNHERLAHPLPVAVSDHLAIAQRQPKGVDVALS
jgi:hypothetical protein